MDVHPVDVDALRDRATGASSEELRARVVAARERQIHRGNGVSQRLNATLTEGEMRRHCRMDDRAETLLVNAQKRLRFSARARAHIIRVSRTMADLDGAETITSEHVGEAIQYRGRVYPT